MSNPGAIFQQFIFTKFLLSLAMKGVVFDNDFTSVWVSDLPRLNTALITCWTLTNPYYADECREIAKLNQNLE